MTFSTNFTDCPQNYRTHVTKWATVTTVQATAPHIHTSVTWFHGAHTCHVIIVIMYTEAEALAWFQADAAVYMRSSFFCDVPRLLDSWRCNQWVCPKMSLLTTKWCCVTSQSSKDHRSTSLLTPDTHNFSPDSHIKQQGPYGNILLYNSLFVIHM